MENCEKMIKNDFLFFYSNQCFCEQQFGQSTSSGLHYFMTFVTLVTNMKENKRVLGF